MVKEADGLRMTISGAAVALLLMSGPSGCLGFKIALDINLISR